MIKRFSQLVSKIIPKAPAKETTIKKEDIECAIDEQTVDCEGEAFTNDALNYYKSYTGIPAPVYLEPDPWFGNEAPPYTEKQQEYRQSEAIERLHEDIRKMTETKESPNIHQEMYELASKNWNTVKETQGGSENFQEGPGGWNSGTGHNQFT
tara:strand:+ start:1028 stop:1483 length:456 start_codon:yes stop_codon:yes gene_type:complete